MSKAKNRTKAEVLNERVEHLLTSSRRNRFPPLKDSKDFQTILTKFLLPISFEGEAVSFEGLVERLERVFQSKSIDVLLYKAKQDFKMLGKPAPRADSSDAARMVKEGDILILRSDHLKPDVLEIQIFRKFSDELETRYFILTKRQFAFVKKYVECKSK